MTAPVPISDTDQPRPLLDTLKTPADLQLMQSLGYKAFLMGERFMIEPDPGAALAGLIESLQEPAHRSSSEGRVAR